MYITNKHSKKDPNSQVGQKCVASDDACRPHVWVCSAVKLTEFLLQNDWLSDY